jgi:WD40 repeat protein
VCLPDGKTVLTAGNDRVVRFWDLETGKQVRQERLQCRGGSVQFVKLSPDGKTVVTCDDRQLVFHEVETGNVLATHPAPKTPSSYQCFSPDGKTLALGRNHPHVTFLKWSAGVVEEVSLSPHWCAYSSHGNFSPDGKWFVASAVGQGEVLVYDLSGGKVSVAHRLPDDFTLASAFSPDGKTLAVTCVISGKEGRESAICLFDVKTGKQRKEISLVRIMHTSHQQ